jgi:hypothetical protein
MCDTMTAFAFWVPTRAEAAAAKPKAHVKDVYERAGAQESDGYRTI